MFEKVNPCHPDKVADRIAGALVDLAYKKAENPRIAVEVLIGHGVCHIIAEASVSIPTRRKSPPPFTALLETSLWTMWKCRRTVTLPITRQTASAAVTTAFSKECP